MGRNAQSAVTANRDPPDAHLHDWQARFRVPSIYAAARARLHRSRGVVIADHEGRYAAYAWEVPNASLRRISDSGAAVLVAAIRPDGSAIIYQRDTTGSEFGHLHSVPFGDGPHTDLTPGLDDYVAVHLRTEGETAVAIVGFGGAQLLLCARPSEVALWPQEASVSHLELADDGSRVAIGELMQGGYGRTVVRSLDDGSPIDTLDYSRPGAMHGHQVAVGAHRGGWLRPMIWVPGGDLRELSVDLPGDVEPTGWSADGATILLYQRHRSKAALYLHELSSATTTLLPMPTGAPWPWGRPELGGHTATMVWSGARTPWRVVETNGRRSRTLLRVAEMVEYPGAEWQDVPFPSADGTTLQGWLLTPSDTGPWPTILFAHGGPAFAATPTWHPFAQAWVDHGYAVLSVNYRGSTTFGDQYREAVIGRVGIVDVDDMVAARHWAVASGIANPELVLLNGFSYGGYLVLQTLATHPDVFAGGIAGSPITDFVGERDDANVLTLAYTDSLFGGDARGKTDALRRASPRTYVSEFTDPLLISTGDADSRTPLAPIREFVDEMRAAGKEVELDVFRGGHYGGGFEDDIRLMQSWIAFADAIVARHVGTQPSPRHS